MKLEKLTKEQESKMLQVKQYWLDYIFSCKNSLNREKAKISIDWLYQFCGLNKPIVIFVDSPMACQYATLYAKAWGKHLQVSGAQVWDQVGAQVGDQVWAQVWAQVRDQGFEFENFAGYQGGSVYDYGWVSFYDFFTQIGVINHKDYNEFRNLLSSGIYDMIQLKGFCIVSDLPKEISRNQNNQLHSVTGPAIAFKDSYSQHYVNGRFLPEKYFAAICEGKYTMQDFINESNEEYKSTCIALMQEKFGEDYLVNFFREHLKEADSYVDKKPDAYLVGTTGGMNVGVYTLFKGTINGEKIAYVRCYCPSTDRMFFLGVDSKHATAKDAIASLYRIPAKLKGHIKSISRQGERFSTILTEAGVTLLNTLSKEEISNVTGLKGDEYFKLMKYEY